MQRDYELLDRILPERVKSVKEWMLLTRYTGQPDSVLKDYVDLGEARKAAAAATKA